MYLWVSKSGILDKKRLKQTPRGRWVPERLFSCQIKVFVAPQRCFGACLGCGYRVSIYLALLQTADRLDDEVERQRWGPRVCRSIPQAGSWQGFSEPLSHKLCERERNGLRGCLMAALLLFTVGQLTVPDPF